MACASHGPSRTPPDWIRLRSFSRLETQDESANEDRPGSVGKLPGQVGEWVLGGTMQHGPIEVEARAVARAVEGLCTLVERNRATKVRAGDGQQTDIAAVLDHEPTESEVTRCVVAA